MLLDERMTEPEACQEGLLEGVEEEREEAEARSQLESSCRTSPLLGLASRSPRPLRLRGLQEGRRAAGAAPEAVEARETDDALVVDAGFEFDDSLLQELAS